jgi:hypothetical protein
MPEKSLEERVAAIEARQKDDREADKEERHNRQANLDGNLKHIDEKIDNRFDELKVMFIRVSNEVFGNGKVEGSICWRLRKLEEWVGGYNAKNDRQWGMVRALTTAVLASLFTIAMQILIKKIGG